MTIPSASILSLRTIWERDIVSREGADTALVVNITAASDTPVGTDRAPIDIAFALDRSGSMSGEPIELVKEAVAAATHHLTDADRVSLVIFDTEIEVLHNLTPATGQGKSRLQRVIQEVYARGGTNLSGGWLIACQQLAMHPPMTSGRGHLQRAMLLTDGLANNGITDSAQLATHASELRRRGIATTTIGVGDHFDEMLLSSMAEAGGGACQYIADPRELRTFFEREIGDLLDIVAIRPRLTITFPEGMHARLVNAFPVERHGRAFTVDLRDLASGIDLSLVFDIRVKSGLSSGTLAPSLKLDWTHPATGQQMGLHRDLDPLTLADEITAARAPRNDEAARTVALERAARDHREAIRLDREGRFEESRSHFRMASRAMQAAPMNQEIREEIRISEELANASFAPLDEHTRKQRVFEAQRRSRGRRQS
jgi:Ca-activated chloride channel family protein